MRSPTVLVAALFAAGAGLTCFSPARAQDAPSVAQAVPVRDFHGGATLPVLATRDLAKPEPDITRAVIVLHGRDRNPATYDAIAHEALRRAGAAGAGALLITPRFADEGDPNLPPGALRWSGNSWMDGGSASAPTAVTAFAALDGLIARLSDRSLFPNLRVIVLAGHSGGAQLVQRYTVLGHADASLRPDLQMRFLVANPSSYSYFSSDRPTEGGGFAPFPVNQCHRFDDWKYGMRDLPDYAGGANAATLEAAFVQRDVTYLLGGADTDPDLSALDKSCAAEAQGPTHLARGRAFFRYLQLRHPAGLAQHEFEVPGVGHDARGMLLSDCALATLFDAPLCGHVSPPATPVPAPVVAPAPTPEPHAQAAAPRRAVRRTPPPPIPHRRPSEHRAAPEAGWDWQPGNWDWNGESYVWVPGRRVRYSRPTARFVPPSWQFDGAEWVWVPAHWGPAS